MRAEWGSAPSRPGRGGDCVTGQKALKVALVLLGIVGVAAVWIEVGEERGSGEVLVMGLIFFAAYFVPTFVAAHRDHHQQTSIMLLNVLLGWTGIGWIAALIWSVSAVKRDPQPAQPAPTAPSSPPPSEPRAQPTPPPPTAKPAPKKWYEER